MSVPDRSDDKGDRVTTISVEEPVILNGRSLVNRPLTDTDIHGKLDCIIRMLQEPRPLPQSILDSLTSVQSSVDSIGSQMDRFDRTLKAVEDLLRTGEPLVGHLNREDSISRQISDADVIIDCLEDLKASALLAPTDSNVIQRLDHIKELLGGSAEGAARQLNTMDEKLSSIQDRLDSMTVDINYDSPEARNCLKDILLPNISDTLINVSNTLIYLMREELKAMVNKHTELKTCLLEINTHLGTQDEANQNAENKMQDLVNKLSSYHTNMDRLHVSIRDLIGQANDNTRLLLGVSQNIRSHST